jgi:hypothetical protein
MDWFTRAPFLIDCWTTWMWHDVRGYLAGELAGWGPVGRPTKWTFG